VPDAGVAGSAQKPTHAAGAVTVVYVRCSALGALYENKQANGAFVLLGGQQGRELVRLDAVGVPPRACRLTSLAFGCAVVRYLERCCISPTDRVRSVGRTTGCVLALDHVRL
jgi:hypothetical protein